MDAKVEQFRKKIYRQYEIVDAYSARFWDEEVYTDMKQAVDDLSELLETKRNAFAQCEKGKHIYSGGDKSICCTCGREKATGKNDPPSTPKHDKIAGDPRNSPQQRPKKKTKVGDKRKRQQVSFRMLELEVLKPDYVPPQQGLDKVFTKPEYDLGQDLEYLDTLASLHNNNNYDVLSFVSNFDGYSKP